LDPFRPLGEGIGEGRQKGRLDPTVCIQDDQDVEGIQLVPVTLEKPTEGSPLALWTGARLFQTDRSLPTGHGRRFIATSVRNHEYLPGLPGICQTYQVPKGWRQYVRFVVGRNDQRKTEASPVGSANRPVRVWPQETPGQQEEKTETRVDPQGNSAGQD